MENTVTKIEGVKAYRDYVHNTIKEKIETYESVSYENYEMESNLEEVEHVSRSGFMPFQEGGYRLTSFLQLGHLEGSGTCLPDKAQKRLESKLENLRLGMSDEFKREYPQAKTIEGVINYSDAEKLELDSEYETYEDEWINGDESIMFILGAHYKDKNEHPIDSNECLCYLTYNFEAPYHRDGRDEICYLEEFTFENKEELQAGLNKAFTKLISDTKLTIK